MIDASGNGTAIWLENGVVMAGSLPFGGSWSTAVAISGSSSSLPSLGIDGSGNVTALWLQSGAVRSATHPFGGSWSAATTVSSTTAATPQLAVDAAGNAVAIWSRSGGVEASIKQFGGSWGTVTLLSGLLSPNTSDSPQIAIGSNGTVIAVWHELISSSSTHSIFSATTTITGLTWNTAVNVIPLTTSFIQNYPQVTIDSRGNGTVVWFRYTVVGTEYQNVTLLSASLQTGATGWSVPLLISNPRHSNPATITLELQVDGSNNVIALWNPSSGGSTFNVETAVLRSGGNWSGFGQIIGLDLYALSADLAVDFNGNALAVFMANLGGAGAAIWSAESDIASHLSNYWTVVQVIAAGSNQAYPSAARSLNGDTVNAIAVWVSYDGTNNRLVASTGSKTILGAPSNVTIVQNSANFRAFPDFYNTISWTASSDPNVVGYAIYRNGVFYTQTISSSVVQVIDHNQIQNGPVTYGVASFDGTFIQSSLVNKSFP